MSSAGDGVCEAETVVPRLSRSRPKGEWQQCELTAASPDTAGESLPGLAETRAITGPLGTLYWGSFHCLYLAWELIYVICPSARICKHALEAFLIISGGTCGPEMVLGMSLPHRFGSS